MLLGGISQNDPTGRQLVIASLKVVAIDGLAQSRRMRIMIFFIAESLYGAQNSFPAVLPLHPHPPSYRPLVFGL